MPSDYRLQSTHVHTWLHAMRLCVVGRHGNCMYGVVAVTCAVSDREKPTYGILQMHCLHKALWCHSALNDITQSRSTQMHVHRMQKLKCRVHILSRTYNIIVPHTEWEWLHVSLSESWSRQVCMYVYTMEWSIWSRFVLVWWLQHQGLDP